MKYPSFLFGSLAGMCILSGCASVKQVAPIENIPTDAPVQKTEMTAQKYRFSPEEIHVKRGILVQFTIRSLDTEHGIAIPRYGIDQDIPKQSKGTISVEFYAREIGTYGFHCSNFCGLGHWGMKGKIIVEE